MVCGAEGRKAALMALTSQPRSPALSFGDALRTRVIQVQTPYSWAGGGVLDDSLPASWSEYEETQNKARGLLKAIEIAQTQL
jgi:anthranilate/para-aminobenzoate synthase component I